MQPAKRVCSGFIMETPLFHVSFSSIQKKCPSASSGKYPVSNGACSVCSAAVCSSSLLSSSQSFVRCAASLKGVADAVPDSIDNIIITEFLNFVKWFSSDSAIALILKWKKVFSYQNKEKARFFWKNHIPDFGSTFCRGQRFQEHCCI